MRKHIREIIRRQAEKAGLKPSEAVNKAWNNYQIRKVGPAERKLNMKRGAKRPHGRRAA